jgi:hypothetical protein
MSESERIVNTLPYPLNIAGVAIPANDGSLPQPVVRQEFGDANLIGGVPVTAPPRVIEIVDLPPQIDGVYYVVPLLVAQAAGRPDLLALGQQNDPRNPGAGHKGLQRFC